MSADVPFKPGSPNWRRPPTPKQAMFKPGTGGDQDPDHLWETVSAAQAGEYLSAVRANLNARVTRTAVVRGQRLTPGRALYEEWDRRFVESLAVQLVEAEVLGRVRPFSGKQLVVLWALYERLAALTAAVLAHDEGGGP